MSQMQSASVLTPGKSGVRPSPRFPKLDFEIVAIALLALDLN
jgi:hypothetical protein